MSAPIKFLDENYDINNYEVIQKPWGSFVNLIRGDGFQVKKLFLKPNSKLSLQQHKFRAEHWTILKGEADVFLVNDYRKLNKLDSVNIELEQKHRLENNTDYPLEVLEVQSGNYLGEDDIIRFDDMYNRV